MQQINPQNALDETNKKAVVTGVILLIALIAVASWLPSVIHSDLADATTRTSVIGAVAIGIERLIEALWSILAIWVPGGFGILPTLPKQVQSLTQQLGDHLDSVRTQAQSALNDITNAGKLADEKLIVANGYMSDISAQIAKLKGNVQGVEQLDKIAKTAVTAITGLQNLVPTAKTHLDDALGTIAQVNDFLDKFKTNPGRQLVSLYLGVMMGILVAWLLGLDIFNDSAKHEDATHLSVAITGLVIGLGASPAHEVIRAVQEFKIAKKAGP